MGWADILGGIASVAGVGLGIYDTVTDNARADSALADAMAATGWQSDIAKEQWNKYKELYLPLEEKRVASATEDLEQMDALKPQLYNEARRNLTLYTPIEDAMIADAQKGVTPEELTGRVSADVNQAFDKADAIQQRNLTRMGINPNSGRYAALGERTNNLRALAEAGGRTEAFKDADALTQEKRRAALSYKQGYQIPTTQTVSGNTALGAALSGFGNTANTMAGLSNSLSNSASDSAAGTAYLINKLTADPSQGGVDWGSALSWN